MTTTEPELVIEMGVQAALDAGLAVNGEYGVAAARHSARVVLEHCRKEGLTREERLEYERRILSAECRAQAVLNGLRDVIDSIDVTQEPANIRAALSALPSREAVRWQPIETAPKDGTDIIGFGNNFGDPTGAQGHHRGIVHWDDDVGDFMDSGESWSRMSYLTHWSPLPLPPVDGGEGL